MRAGTVPVGAPLGPVDLAVILLAVILSLQAHLGSSVRRADVRNGCRELSGPQAGRKYDRGRGQGERCEGEYGAAWPGGAGVHTAHRSSRR
ncbi:Hypothetical Protein sle_01150 [Streptomyces leeuwenhoekii]|uniref:Uncharacterized protein n=1 Tax=Streptomyces leeuwenhoekii TaxID=1437453 RepID=A0A0F7VQ88_STRLW|nr:Hypothetical Protein sle_01150 [Streptomyces leeuwenhoekii]